MMGPIQRREPKLFYANMNLDERVDPAHPLRKIAATVDFAFVRSAVAPCYGRRGNPSEDPTLLLKLLFLVFYENVASERELMRQLPCRLDWLWFLELDLDSAIPDHSVLSKARRRWGPAVFTAFFQRVLEQCVRAGLVDGARVHVDASLITANADTDKLTLALHWAGQSFYGQLESAAEPAAAPAPEPAPARAEPGRVVAVREEADSVPSSPALPADLPPGTLYCPTDPEARLTRKYGQSVLGYKDHRVVDDRCGIITATLTTAAATDDGAMLLAALDKHEANTGSHATEPTADKAYGTVDNYRQLQRRGCLPCIPHKAVREDPAMFPRSSFIYDPQRDAYRCPAEQTLTRRGGPVRKRYRYLASWGVCQRCPLRQQCTAGVQRKLSRQVHQEAVDWADGCLSRTQRRLRMRRRKIRAEGSFADAANRHGYKRARWRGRTRMEIQNLLIATTQNLRKLVRYGRQTPRRSAGRLSRNTLNLPAIPATIGRWQSRPDRPIPAANKLARYRFVSAIGDN